MLREIRDLPGAILREHWRARKEFIMQSPMNDEKRMNAFGVLAGVLPFVFLGPLQAIIPYLPRDMREVVNIGSDLVMMVFLIVTAIGTIIGSTRGFPRWSYPHLIAFVMLFLMNGVGRLSSLIPRQHLALEEDLLLGARLAMLFAFFVVLATIVVLIARMLKPLQSLYQGIRQDWTLLSFGLFSYVAFAFGFYGGDHPPPFGLGVALPSLIVVLGALLHMLSTNRRDRILALLFSLVLLPVAGRLEEGWWFAPLFLGAVVFMPALLELLPRDKKIETA